GPSTASTMTSMSWSTSKSKPAPKLPSVIQVKNSWWKSAGPEWKNSRTASTAQRKESPVEVLAVAVTYLFGHFAPNSPLTAEPRSGNSGTIHKDSSIG